MHSAACSVGGVREEEDENDLLKFCLFVLAIDSLLSMAIYYILTTLA